MPQSLAKILIHGVFSTKDRRPFLSDVKLRSDLHAYMGGALATLNCQPLIVGGVEDHVHFLCVLSRTITVAEMFKETKRVSTLWLKTQHASLAGFNWQNGYGGFSIGESQVEPLRTYIANQEAHHKKMTYQDEFRRLLTKYGIDFDERYVWD